MTELLIKRRNIYINKKKSFRANQIGALIKSLHQRRRIKIKRVFESRVDGRKVNFRFEWHRECSTISASTRTACRGCSWDLAPLKLLSRLLTKLIRRTRVVTTRKLFRFTRFGLIASFR